MRKYVLGFAICFAFLSSFAVGEEIDPNKLCLTPGNWVDYDCNPHPGECRNACHGLAWCAVPAPERCALVGPKPTVCFCDYSRQHD